MATLTRTLVDVGRWSTQAVNWTTNQGMRATGAYPQMYGGARATALDLAQGAEIMSATLTLDLSQGSISSDYVRVSLLDRDHSGTIVYADRFVDRTGYSTATGSYPTVTIDLRSQLQHVVDRAGWTPGNAVTFYVEYTYSAGGLYASGGSLAVEYVDPVQFLTPTVVPAAASVLPVSSVTTAVTVAAAVVATASALPPSVVAPVAVQAAHAVTAHATAPPVTVRGTGPAPPLTAAAPAAASASALPPTLSRTAPPEPPPIPWERLIEDPAYHAALLSRQPLYASRAEIVAPDGAIIAKLGGPTATHPGALSGTVSCDSTRAIRWECDLVLDNPDLLPRGPSDMLHPLSHNRIRLWWGVRLPDGTLGEVPVGTYHPDLTPTSDDGLTLGVRIRGSSAVAEVKRARWDDALDLSGATVSEAIDAILANRAPWATTAITPTTERVPATYEPGEPGSDPWEDVQRLAAVAGMVAYEDRMGIIRVDPRPTVGAPRAEFVEGDGTALVELSSIETDLDWVLNKVTVASASPDVDPPVTGVATDDDPSSPLWVGRGHLYSLRVENAIITTQQAAETMARNILADRAPVVTVQAAVVPHPHLDPGDTVSIGRARAGATGAYSLVSWSLTLGPDGDMQITATSRKEMPR